MNARLYQATLSMRGMATAGVAVVLFSLALAGRPSAAENPAPRQSVEEQQKKRPYAAGRHRPGETEEAPAPKDEKHAMDMAKLDCGACHVCDNPMREQPCLRKCPRSVAEVIAAAAHEKLPDDLILLCAFERDERRFMPVPFDHKRHADMAGMAGGCDVCHHHTAEGKLHPACKTCHKAEYAATAIDEMRMPSLKGAYHRQCMGCHRDWAHNTRCGLCHLPVSEQEAPTDNWENVLPPGDVAGAHPSIENPEHIPYKTEYEPGPNVMFRHTDHVKVYGYECERCHRGQNCARCHEKIEKPKERFRVVEGETHGMCFACHEEDACERCHSKQENPPPQRFDHSTTGFSLEKYHGNLTCRACHKRLFFLRKLEQECSFCHKGWDANTFDHGVTGQKLDENHADIDCKECHADGRFVRPPSCDECHDPDDGVTFPARRPGPTLAPAMPESK